jgi:hypothetical protein
LATIALSWRGSGNFERAPAMPLRRTSM